jgi:hypothetical protein
LIGVYKKHIIKTVKSGARDRQQRNAADNPLEFLKNTYSRIPPFISSFYIESGQELYR